MKMTKFLGCATLGCAILSFAVTSLAADHNPQPYNEIYAADGSLRPAYQRFEAKTGIPILKPTEEVAEHLMGSPLNDKITVAPIPLVLGAEEYERIQAGVFQRAKIYRALFTDLVLGNQDVLNPETGLSRELVETAFAATGVSLGFYRKVYSDLDPKAVRFMLGPDLARTPAGEWVVLEDNIANSFGGTSDADAIHAAYLSQFARGTPLLAELPTGFLQMAVSVFITELDHVEAPTIVTLAAAAKAPENHNERADMEDQRSLDELHRLNIKKNFFEESPEFFAALENAEGHAVVINYGLDAPSLLGAHGEFLRAIGRNDVHIMSLPGIEALSNKIFLPYMEKLSRFYLQEDLILRSPPSLPLSWSQISESRPGEDFGVVKRGDGLAGFDVHIYKNMTYDERDELSKFMLSVESHRDMVSGHSYPQYIAQEFVNMSYLPLAQDVPYMRLNVDIRPLAYVGGERTYVHPFPWGRASGKFAGRLNNVSRGAMELVVFTECEEMLK